MADADISRGEFELLRQIISDLSNRMLSLDDHGTRGVTALQVQVTEIIKDLADMKLDVNNRFDAHAHQHAEDRKERRSSRRWLIGIGITAILALATIGSLLAQLLITAHG